MFMILMILADLLRRFPLTTTPPRRIVKKIIFTREYDGPFSPKYFLAFAKVLTPKDSQQQQQKSIKPPRKCHETISALAISVYQ
jgi:hypothetical protein